MQDNEFNPENNTNPEENKDFTVSEDSSSESPGNNESFDSNEPEISANDFVASDSSPSEEKPVEEPKPEEAPAEESAPTADTDLSDIEHPAEESSSDDVDLTTDSAAETAAANAAVANAATQQKTAFIPIIIGIFSVLSIGSIIALIVYVIMPIGSGPTKDDYSAAYDKASALQASCTPQAIGTPNTAGFIKTLKDQHERCVNDYTELKAFAAIEKDEDASELLAKVLSNLELIGKFIEDVSDLSPVEQAFIAVLPDNFSQSRDWDEYLNTFYDSVEALSDNEAFADFYDILSPLMEEYYDTALEYLDSIPFQKPQPLDDEDTTGEEGDDSTAVDDTDGTDCVDPNDTDCAEVVIPGGGDPEIFALLQGIADEIQAALDEFLTAKLAEHEISIEQIEADAKKLTEHLQTRAS